MKTMLAAILAIAVLGAAPMYSGAPDASLASSFIGSGGGSGSFSMVRAFDGMIGSDATLAEEQSLRNEFGAAGTDRFIHEFDYAVSDAWTVASRKNVKLPAAPAQTGDAGLARALVAAGTTGGGFSTNYLFAHLFSSAVASQVMQDIDSRYGSGSSAHFEQMGDRFFSDVAKDANG
jgi:hypothetical protein